MQNNVVSFKETKSLDALGAKEIYIIITYATYRLGTILSPRNNQGIVVYVKCIKTLHFDYIKLGFYTAWF